MKTRYFLPFLALILNLSFSNNSIYAQTKTDVWDFGADQLDTDTYNNMLDAATINAWYPSSVTPGSAGNTFPSSFTSGILSWTSNGTNDRLRTSNTDLTRYDSNAVPVTWGSETLRGYLYINSGGNLNRFFTLNLNEDDELTILAKSQNGTGKMTFELTGEAGQKDVHDLTTSVNEYSFVAQKAGAYKIYDSVDKPFYYRIYRKPATYATVSGMVDVSKATDIPAGYTLVFTNEAGKVWTATPDETHNYSVQVPAGYTYNVSLDNANSYIITSDTQVQVTENTTYNPKIGKVLLKTLSGELLGLPADLLSKLTLIFTPAVASEYTPDAEINTVSGTYSVALESGMNYTISATGVNDYFISNNSVSIVINNDTLDINFEAKPTYKVTLNLSETPEIVSLIKPVFTNLDEPEYAYEFADIDNITLRDGTYSLKIDGLDEYPLQLGLTSNVKVDGEAVAKDIYLIPVNIWSFEDKQITASTTAYKGMLFTGAPYNEQGKGHLVLKNADTAKVPLMPGEKMIINYYYSANFYVDDGDTVSTSSGSTSQLETKEYVYQGTSNGYMTIKNIPGTTSYITEVRTAKIVPYSAEVFVGKEKEYQSVNEALQAIRSMERPDNDTIKIWIEPGNYEEMLVIDVPNIALINAAENPDIALSNKGVDISPNAVRITSYYGHGYNYFSMKNNQKWDADVLRVNKENGYTEYSNTGSGTGNGSYWNATVVVSAPDFYAENIIFENSFNQYISKKESEDVVVEWESGGKGTRPTAIGSTDVQNKSFVERAAAIAYTKSGDKSILYNCRIIGRQDSFFGDEGARVVVYKGSLMGATDYIFGGMTLVAYQTELAMNTSEASTDVSYITAAQQQSSRGFLFYETTITSALPGIETASAYLSKPGYFGRPWRATTSEVVFYNTTINATNNPNYDGKSLILPIGWNNTLGGESDKVYEYGTIEKSGENNQSSRATWSHLLTEPTLNDGTEINTFNFTKGNDNWDPIPALKSKDEANGTTKLSQSDVVFYTIDNKLVVSNVKLDSLVEIFRLDGKLFLSKKIKGNESFNLSNGIWIARAVSQQGTKTEKIVIK
ncbi:MAG: pectinesterase family protein [Paludibacter sp.]|jgi:pectin methylesterase-like acyl-CoA thioesterase